MPKQIVGTVLEVGDLAVVTGPLTLGGEVEFDGNPAVFLTPGEVVSIRSTMEHHDGTPTAYAWGHESHCSQHIDITSLTPLSTIQDDPDVEWGEGLGIEDADAEAFQLRWDGVHDYVWEGDE